MRQTAIDFNCFVTIGDTNWSNYSLQFQARKISGVQNIQWLDEFPKLFHRLMCECEHVYLNSNEHPRADIQVQTRDARFAADVVQRYPLHDYQRLGRLMHQLRVVKTGSHSTIVQVMK